jgi:sigma-B regulation protein RsbU (phosphoserine phosphatase)
MIGAGVPQTVQAAKPDNEAERIAALSRYDILDTPHEEQFEDVTRLVARVCEAPMAIISLIDRERQWFAAEVGLGICETPRDISFCAHALLQPDLLIVPDTHLDRRFAQNPLVTGDPHIRFYAGAPLATSDGHILGTLCVLDHKTRELTGGQLETLQVMAGQVMKQLELRRLLREQATVIAEKEQARAMLDAALAHEKNIAETLQRSLLIEFPAHAFPGLEVFPLYASAWSEADVGGDFYDAFAVGEDKVALVIGDVSGKGLAAAARTAEVKYALRAFLQEYPSPARTLARLNDFLCQFHDYAAEASPRFVVAALGLLDIRTGELRLSFAGAEPLLLLRENGHVDTQEGAGLPLGIQPGAEYDTIVQHLGPGDTLLLATDGLTEARRDGIALEHTGLARLLAETKEAETLKAQGNAMLSHVKAYSGGTLRDDACLLLARRASDVR